MGLKTLIVDDDDIVVFIHRLILKDSGISDVPLIFRNGKTAYDYISGHTEEPCLVFLDLNMPIMDGWQFLDLIEDSSFLISVVIVSSSIDPADLQKATTYSKVIRFVEKPLSVKVCDEIRNGHDYIFT